METKMKPFVAAVLCLATFAGCSREENGKYANGDGMSLPKFTATIDGVKTRAFDRQWEEGDEIGISADSYSNICYLTKDGDGKFSVKTPGYEIYFNPNEEVSFTAYYPWNIVGGVTAISANTREQSKQKSFDFLWAQASSKKGSPEVAFNFAHKMANLILKIRFASGVSLENLKIERFWFLGLMHNGTFSISDGSTSLEDNKMEIWAFFDSIDPSNNAPVTVDEASGAMTFSLIFFPQKFDSPLSFSAQSVGEGENNWDAKIDFTEANRQKDGADAKNELVGGRQYILTMLFSGKALSVEDIHLVDKWFYDGSEDVDSKLI